MLKLADETQVLSSADLTSYLACPHLIQQRYLRARGQRAALPLFSDPHSVLLRARGEEHEKRQFDELQAELGSALDLSHLAPPTSSEELEAAAAQTEAAMREGAPLIYQASLFDGRWQGRVDFLKRVPVESALGGHSYEVLDTKLSREVKPNFVHQLWLYSRLVGELQGLVPERAYVLTGEGTSVAIELSRYAALHRHVAGRMEALIAAEPVLTYPEPVAHCSICDLAGECRKRRADDDHLSLVATMRRENQDRLVRAGISTVLELAGAVEPEEAPLAMDRFTYLHNQADLQVDSRESGEPMHRHLEPSTGSGYALLPEPSQGDVYFDLEGDPYVGTKGIEYLWGWCVEGTYECRWAHDSGAEKASLEEFVDRVTQLREAHPGMHIFHYAPHERAKLRTLSIAHGTRENEVDALLRGEVLVDLYAVVRQALQVGEESYSLKALERHHAFERLEKSVREGGGSIAVYENWLESGAGEFLEAIRAYNEEDCRSTMALRGWLDSDMRPEAEADLGVDFAELRDPDEDERGPPEWMPEVLELIEQLRAEREDYAEDPAARPERELLANLLLYHHRESKPGWWRYFDLKGMPIRDLVEDREALAGLRRLDEIEPMPYKRSLDYVFTFPAQEFKLGTGDAEDPFTGEGHKIVAVAADRVTLRRGQTKPPPQPQALIEKSPVVVTVLREALIELARAVLANDLATPVSRELLRAEPPRLASGSLGEDVDSLVAATLGLDRSVLPIQGPPGTGKTFRAARMVCAALAEGRRVGVTAPTHAAIQNLLAAVGKHAGEIGLLFRGVYKDKDGDFEDPYGLLGTAKDNADVEDEHQLVAGTPWLFARPEHRGAFDLILVDEAGQFPLANTVAISLATENLVLLGDPQQLPQVTQAEHPEGAGASALEHILAGEKTIPPDRGVLLTETWRMHPQICAFVSERSYDGRLNSREACSRREVLAPNCKLNGNGLRSALLHHEGRSQSSPEEAEAIAAACRELLAEGSFADVEGEPQGLQAADIMVVAPYNLAVREIAERVPEGVRVGTVDRFQGQEAPVVFYAMTCSAGEDVPRGMEFLFDAHRLNVAVSRAQALAVLVHSPRLLDANCPTLRAMELVDGVCRFAEMATPVAL